jgi:outer membrane receptor protein involved in Fe transport
VFYKKIDHFITDAQYPVEIGNLGTFIEFSRVNGEAAKAMGVELSWQSERWELPANLGRMSIEANYSLNHGEAHHRTRPGETFPLPRQVDNQGGLRVHDVVGDLTLDAGVTYRSGWWEDLIAPGLDNYIVSSWDAELSANWQLSKTLRVTGGFSNLLNRPTQHYAGDPSRFNDWQRSGVDMNVGVQWKL